MLPIALYYGDLVEVALAAVSAILTVVSIGSFRRRSEGRYLLLMLAFASLCVVSVSTALLELFVDLGPTTIRSVEEYLNPSLELLMAVCLLVAVTWSTDTKNPLGRTTSPPSLPSARRVREASRQADDP